MSSFATSSRSRGLSAWLLFMIALVVLMILVGGATRLTNAGLSITEWRPISGALPPMSGSAWASEFEKYRQIPEFAQENPGMTLEGFKFIYFMEWSHRQLGRFIGLAYLFPLIGFMMMGKLPRGKKGRLIGIFLMICFQGAIGWWMVSSGLKDRVDVSQYRLAAHLGVAFIILAMLFYSWQDSREGWPTSRLSPKLGKRTRVLFLLIFLQIIAGAFVAGTHAGQAYNTWPLMDGGFAPSAYFTLKPWWLNIFENIASIQFNHRMLGYGVLLVAMWVWGAARHWREPAIIKSSGWLLAGILFQIILGIVALLKIVELPYALAHQAGAIFVFLCAVWTMRSARARAY